ncbi:hypothetical protein BJ742DRAFT_560211 [Cladochytrium replicatum]|nr:hypothetical protein BJ742DRAFT_560211 [Cladochytrium replicatum]
MDRAGGGGEDGKEGYWKSRQGRPSGDRAGSDSESSAVRSNSSPNRAIGSGSLGSSQGRIVGRLLAMGQGTSSTPPLAKEKPVVSAATFSSSGSNSNTYLGPSVAFSSMISSKSSSGRDEGDGGGSGGHLSASGHGSSGSGFSRRTSTSVGYNSSASSARAVPQLSTATLGVIKAGGSAGASSPAQDIRAQLQLVPESPATRNRSTSGPHENFEKNFPALAGSGSSSANPASTSTSRTATTTINVPASPVTERPSTTAPPRSNSASGPSGIRNPALARGSVSRSSASAIPPSGLQIPSDAQKNQGDPPTLKRSHTVGSTLHTLVKDKSTSSAASENAAPAPASPAVVNAWRRPSYATDGAWNGTGIPIAEEPDVSDGSVGGLGESGEMAEIERLRALVPKVNAKKSSGTSRDRSKHSSSLNPVNARATPSQKIPVSAVKAAMAAASSNTAAKAAGATKSAMSGSIPLRRVGGVAPNEAPAPPSPTASTRRMHAPLVTGLAQLVIGKESKGGGSVTTPITPTVADKPDGFHHHEKDDESEDVVDSTGAIDGYQFEGNASDEHKVDMPGGGTSSDGEKVDMETGWEITGTTMWNVGSEEEHGEDDVVAAVPIIDAQEGKSVETAENADESLKPHETNDHKTKSDDGVDEAAHEAGVYGELPDDESSQLQGRPASNERQSDRMLNAPDHFDPISQLTSVERIEPISRPVGSAERLLSDFNNFGSSESSKYGWGRGLLFEQSDTTKADRSNAREPDIWDKPEPQSNLFSILERQQNVAVGKSRSGFGTAVGSWAPGTNGVAQESKISSLFDNSFNSFSLAPGSTTESVNGASHHHGLPKSRSSSAVANLTGLDGGSGSLRGGNVFGYLSNSSSSLAGSPAPIRHNVHDAYVESQRLGEPKSRQHVGYGQSSIGDVSGRDLDVDQPVRNILSALTGCASGFSVPAQSTPPAPPSAATTAAFDITTMISGGSQQGASGRSLSNSNTGILAQTMISSPLPNNYYSPFLSNASGELNGQRHGSATIGPSISANSGSYYAPWQPAHPQTVAAAAAAAAAAATAVLYPHPQNPRAFHDMMTATTSSLSSSSSTGSPGSYLAHSHSSISLGGSGSLNSARGSYLNAGSPGAEFLHGSSEMRQALNSGWNPVYGGAGYVSNGQHQTPGMHPGYYNAGGLDYAASTAHEGGSYGSAHGYIGSGTLAGQGGGNGAGDELYQARGPSAFGTASGIPGQGSSATGSSAPSGSTGGSRRPAATVLGH